MSKTFPPKVRWTPGFTLVEMLVTMTVSSTLLALATGMIHQTMALQSQGRKRAARQQVALRLASQFRRDLRHGGQAALRQDGATLILEGTEPGDATVTYSAEDGRVLRAQQRADGRLQREPFRFGPDDQAHFELLPNPRRAAVVITHPARRLGDQPRLVLHVEGVLGRHWAGPFAVKGHLHPDKEHSSEEAPR